jgi:hypothetical protein
VRLVVDPTWSTVSIQLQPLTGTASYPVPFSFSSSCAAPGTGSLTANFASVVLKSGPNPGCDYFVQFTGGSTALQFKYFD